MRVVKEWLPVFVPVFLLSLFLLLVVLGGSSPKLSQKHSALPIRATQVEDLGNGWYTFCLDGYSFFYVVGSSGDRALVSHKSCQP